MIHTRKFERRKFY